MPLPPENYLGIAQHADGAFRLVSLTYSYDEESIIDPSTGLSVPVGIPIYKSVTGLPEGAVIVHIFCPDDIKG
ncbi:MAG: hypothetical protein AAB557_00190 [Patescibacteria group bacterium]